jgi:hypothetical protein
MKYARVSEIATYDYVDEETLLSTDPNAAHLDIVRVSIPRPASAIDMQQPPLWCASFGPLRNAWSRSTMTPEQSAEE